LKKVNPWETVSANWHVNQSPVTKPNRVSIQDIINLLPADETKWSYLIHIIDFMDYFLSGKKSENNSKIPVYHKIL